MGSTKAIYLRQLRPVTRTGTNTDVASQKTTDLFTVTGDNLIIGIYGKVITAKQATTQTLRLGHVPTIVGAEAFLCAVSATTLSDAINQIYIITGVPGDAMIVDQVSSIIGVGQFQINALGNIQSALILVPGVIRMTTGAADDNVGVIDWTVIYQSLSDTSEITVL